jgi:ElaB/YqjD/DUF883 family membrane-anchored ribosome-binding protein
MAGNGRHRATEVDLQADVDALREDFATLRGDLATLVSDALQEGKGKASAARERLEQMAAERAEEVKQCAVEAGRKVDDAVRTHPLAALGMALGAGLLLGSLFRK